MKKATSAANVDHFEQIPNVGKSVAQDFKLLGIKTPQDLKKQDPYLLYVKLCQKTKTYHDPCVLDTLIAVVDFMSGGRPLPWWNFTAERKKNFKKVEAKILKFKS